MAGRARTPADRDADRLTVLDSRAVSLALGVVALAIAPQLTATAARCIAASRLTTARAGRSGQVFVDQRHVGILADAAVMHK